MVVSKTRYVYETNATEFHNFHTRALITMLVQFHTTICITLKYDIHKHYVNNLLLLE